MSGDVNHEPRENKTISINNGDYGSGDIHKRKGMLGRDFHAPAIGSVEGGTVQIFDVNININIDTISKPEIDELLNILKTDETDKNHVIKTYHRYLDSRYWTGEKPNDLREILHQITTNSSNPETSLKDFLKRLIANEKISQSCRHALSQRYGFTNADGQDTEVRSYLLVKLTPSATDTDKEKFFVKAWLIPDDSVREPKNRFTPINFESEKSVGTKYSLKEIQAQDGVVKKILDKSLEIIASQPNSKQLTIEFFLPKDYVWLNLHQWEISDDFDKFKIGFQRPVVVRSHERLEQRYQKKIPDWRWKWNQVKQLENSVNEDIFEVFSQVEQLKKLRDRLAVKAKIGLKMTCAAFVKQPDIVNALLSSATPIAIGPIYDTPGLNCANEIDLLLKKEPIRHLPDYLHEKRQEEEYVGKDLALLWEDPDRLTPDVEYILELPTSAPSMRN
jgi:hypothetical protein